MKPPGKLKHGLLQTPVGGSYCVVDRKVEDFIFESFRHNSDKFGVYTTALRKMYWLPTGALKAMGNQVHARGPKPREQLVCYLDLRGRTSAPGWIALFKSLAEIYETPEKGPS